MSSWVDRTAAQLDLQRRDVWLHTGLIDHPQGLPVAYGVALPADRRQLLQSATGLPKVVVDGLLLSRYDPAVVPWTSLDLTRPDAIRQWARAAYVFVWPSLGCPLCIRESEGVWKVAWKLPWSFVCPEHRCYLVAECPSCGKRLQSNVLDRRQQLICCASSALGPARPRRDGHTRTRRHKDDICGTQITQIVPVNAGPSIVALQLRILPWAESPATVAGGAIHPLAEMRRLMTFVLYFGVPALLADMDQVVQDRFAQHVAERDAPVARRGSDATHKDRQYSLPLADPPLIAAAADVAARLVFADDLDEAWESVMAPILRNSPDASGQWFQLRKFWSPPERHASALSRARESHVFVVASLDGRRARHARSLQRRYAPVDARHVPALMWSNAYAYLADGLIEQGWTVAGRRFAALALARHLEPDLTTWEAAAKWFDTDGGLGDNAYRWIGRLRHRGLGAEFERRLHVLAATLAARPVTIDYQARRRELTQLNDLGRRDWVEICAASGIDANLHWWSLRRPQAAAWLWTNLTGGDWHHAPSLRLATLSVKQRQVTSQAYAHYFLSNHLAKIRPALTDFASVMLDRHNLRGPVQTDLDIKAYE